MTRRPLVLLLGPLLAAGCAGQAGETPCERYAAGAGALAAEVRQLHQDADTPPGRPAAPGTPAASGTPGASPAASPGALDVPLAGADEQQLADALADCLAER